MYVCVCVWMYICVSLNVMILHTFFYIIMYVKSWHSPSSFPFLLLEMHHITPITTNSKVIQRARPITHPAMIPTGEPSSSLLPRVPATTVNVVDNDAIVLVLVDITVDIAIAVSLVDVIKVVRVAVVVSL